jgi:hypothetical protein
VDPKTRASGTRDALENAGLAPLTRNGTDFAFGAPAGPDSAGKFLPSAQNRATVRLISSERYFGLAARVFHAGAQQMLARISAQPADTGQLDLECLGRDFSLDPAPSLALLRAMVEGGLLVPDGTGYYRPTARFVEYALAPVVAPLSRARAKSLIEAVHKTAERVNAEWAQNPLQIRTIAVSGSYMSRSDRLPELTVWLVLRPRPAAPSRRWRPMVSKGTGLRQILSAIDALSSFIRVRIVASKRAVPRPFCVVFEAVEAIVVEETASRRLRQWGAAIGELLAGGSYVAGARGRGSRR